jgi:hypothetical protein
LNQLIVVLALDKVDCFSIDTFLLSFLCYVVLVVAVVVIVFVVFVVATLGITRIEFI